MNATKMSCAISNVAIERGDRVALFILKRTTKKIPSAVMYMSAHEFYQPEFLPIFGEYDGNLSLTHIRLDENLKGIEKYFEQKIFDVLKTIEKKDMALMFVREEIYLSLASDAKEKNRLSDEYVKGYMLEELGFLKVDKSEQKFSHSHSHSIYRKPGIPYDVFLGHYGTEVVHQDEKQYFCPGSQNHLAPFIKQWAEFTNTDPEVTFPKTKKEGSATEQEYEEIKKVFYSLTGFHLGSAKKRHSIYRLKDLFSLFEELTGESWDMTKYKETVKFDQYYDEFRTKLLDTKSVQEKIIKKINESQLSEEDEYFIERLFSTMRMEAMRSGRYKHIEYDESEPLDLISPLFDSAPGSFFECFRGWEHMNLYANAILEGELKEDFTNYRGFYMTMLSANRLFFPSLINTSTSNDAVSILLKVSQKILESKLEGYEDFEAE